MRSLSVILGLASFLMIASAQMNLTTESTRNLNMPADDMDMMYSQLYFYMGTKVKYIFSNLET